MNRHLMAGLVGIGVAIAAVAAWGILREDSTSSSTSHGIVACNGSARLCDRPLNDVVLPATHNSFAGADVPGFRFPEQEVGIGAQLDDGIRGLLVDTYYGVPGIASTRTPRASTRR